MTCPTCRAIHPPDACPFDDVVAVSADQLVADIERVLADRRPPNPVLARLGRRLNRHAGLAHALVHVPGLGRLIAAAAEAEWRDVVAAERKARGLD